MYQSRFNFFGQTGLILTLGILAPILDVGLLINFIQTGSDGKALLFVGPLLLFATAFVWRKILIEMNHVTVTDSCIEIRNPVTKRTTKIEKQNTKGVKDIFRNGYTILIVDNSNKVIGKIHDYYYKDFHELCNNLGLKYLGRIPTLLDKIIKIETEE